MLLLLFCLQCSAVSCTATWVCVGFVTRELEERRCSRPATALVLWVKCIKAAWRSGCHPPTPATVNFVTLSSLLNGDHSHSLRLEKFYCVNSFLFFMVFYKKRLVCGFILGAPVASHYPQTLVRLIGDSELTVWLSASMNGCLFLCMRPVIDWVYPTSSLMSGGIGSNLGSIRG